MISMLIDDRKQKVLSAIINIYSLEGEPVGSSVLRDYLNVQLSTATLRNEMASLTKLGLLMQPHTSAGRIPSVEGYRYYLDNLLENSYISKTQQYFIDELFSSFDYEPRSLLQNATAGLAELTGYTALATAPRQKDSHFVRYELVQVGNRTVTILGISKSGMVYTRSAHVKKALTAADLEFLLIFLNTKMAFLSASDLTPETLRSLLLTLGARATNLLPVIHGAMQLLIEMNSPRIFTEGIEHLLNYRELEGSLKGTIALFGDNSFLENTLLKHSQQDIHCFFGEDIPNYYLPNLCILSSPYQAGGGMTGALALVGPARMNYLQMVPILRYFSNKLGQAFMGTEQGGEKNE